MNATGELGAIQTGPNSQLYVAVNTSSSLSTISVNEDTTFGSNSTFIADSQPLAPGTNSTLGLPSFTQNMLNPPSQASMSVSSPVCVNQTINLNGFPVSVIDEYEWRINQLPGLNNIFFSSSQNDTTSISIAGNYEVSLRVFNRCNLDTTITQTIVVNDVPAFHQAPRTMWLLYVTAPSICQPAMGRILL